jgi:hypothetical protein
MEIDAQGAATHISATSGYNDIIFNTLFRSGWKRFLFEAPSRLAKIPSLARGNVYT